MPRTHCSNVSSGLSAVQDETKALAQLQARRVREAFVEDFAAACMDLWQVRSMWPRTENVAQPVAQ